MSGLEQPSLALGTDGEVAANVDPVQVVVKTLKAGDATHKPKKGQTVRIHYDAYLQSSGEMFVSLRQVPQNCVCMLTNNLQLILPRTHPRHEGTPSSLCSVRVK